MVSKNSLHYNIIARICSLPRTYGENLIANSNPEQIRQSLIEEKFEYVTDDHFFKFLAKLRASDEINLKWQKTLLNYIEKFSFPGNGSKGAGFIVTLSSYDYQVSNTAMKTIFYGCFLNPMASYRNKQITFYSPERGNRRDVYRRRKIEVSDIEMFAINQQFRKNHPSKSLEKFREVGLILETKSVNQEASQNTVPQIIVDIGNLEEITDLIRETYEALSISRMFHQDGWFRAIKKYIRENIGQTQVGILELFYELDALQQLPFTRDKLAISKLELLLDEAINKTILRGETELKLENHPQIVKACEELKNKQIFDFKFFYSPKKGNPAKGWLRLTKEESVPSDYYATDGSDFIFAEVDFSNDGLENCPLTTKYLIETERKTTLDREKVIVIEDLELLLFKDQLNLRWKKNGKLIIPVFNQTFLPQRDSNPILRLLYFISLQYQNSLEGIVIAFNKFKSNLALSYKGILLQPRRREMKFFEVSRFNLDDFSRSLVLICNDRRYHFTSDQNDWIKRLKKIEPLQPVILEDDWSRFGSTIDVNGRNHQFELIGHILTKKSPPLFNLAPKRVPRFLENKTFSLQVIMPRMTQMQLAKIFYEISPKMTFIRLKSTFEEIRFRFYEVDVERLITEISRKIEENRSSLKIYRFSFTSYDLEPDHFVSEEAHHLVNLLLAADLNRYFTAFTNFDDFTHDRFKDEVMHVASFAEALCVHPLFADDINEIKKIAAQNFSRKASQIVTTNIDKEFSSKEDELLIMLRNHWKQLESSERALIFFKVLHLKCSASHFAITRDFEASVVNSLFSNHQ
jgi:hypothetical protein